MEKSNTLDAELSNRPPTREEREIALAAMEAIANTATTGGALRLDRAAVELPPAIGQMVLALLKQITQGEAVAVVSIGADLTTQQAADILDVSRPHLIKLLEAGDLPYHMTGSHRRVRASDAIAFRASRDAMRDKALDELAALGQQIEDA